MSGNNRHRIKQWAITFPHSGDLEREEFMKNFPPIVCGFVSQEEHKDGTPHLHAGFKLKKGITKKQMGVWVKAKFPNDNLRIQYKPTMNVKNWEDYCSKEDPLMWVKNKETDDHEAKYRRIFNAWKYSMNCKCFRSGCMMPCCLQWSDGWNMEFDEKIEAKQRNDPIMSLKD